MWHTPTLERASQSGESMHEGLVVKSGVKTILVCGFKETESAPIRPLQINKLGF